METPALQGGIWLTQTRWGRRGEFWVATPNLVTRLHQVHTELLEGLQQAGVPDLLDDKNTLWGLVPRQPLAGRVLDMPVRAKERSHQEHAFPREDRHTTSSEACLSGPGPCASPTKNLQNHDTNHQNKRRGV